jgi:hypothetical protein
MNDYLNRVGRPAPAAAGGAPAPAPQTVGGGSKKVSGKIDGFKIFFVILFGALAVLLVALIVYIIFYRSDIPVTDKVKADQYQAVFLNSSDGQVYFGKLSTLNHDYYKLTDIYYVRVQTVQPDKNTTQTQQSISLAKLGNEIHGPEDVMYINKDSVMFWENLKADGQVVKAITEYIKNGKQATTPTPSQTETSPTPTKK